jgi:hypothetical protein
MLHYHLICFRCIEHFKLASQADSSSPSENNEGSGEAAGAARTAELKMLEGELASIQELSFAFRRAASRLTEMSSTTYSTIVINRSC